MREMQAATPPADACQRKSIGKPIGKPAGRLVWSRGPASSTRSSIRASSRRPRLVPPISWVTSSRLAGGVGRRVGEPGLEDTHRATVVGVQQPLAVCHFQCQA
jgi:hypothetical protein